MRSSRLWLLLGLIAATALAAVSCAETSRFDVVVATESVTVWDASGKGMTVPMEDVTIHGIENLPKPTATPASRPTPTPMPKPAPIPTPAPGSVTSLDQSWTNPFMLKMYEGRRVSVEAQLDYMTLMELGGWTEDVGDYYVTCWLPEDLSDSDLALLSTLELHQPITFVGTLESDDFSHYLADCLPASSNGAGSP